MNVNKDYYEAISPTAWLVAYRRTFTDIPLCGDIFSELEKLPRPKELTPELMRPEMAPQFEARYKLIDKLFRKIGIKQVLELASGLSPRGLNLALEGITYVEVDLAKVLDIKRNVIKRLKNSDKIGDIKNLYLENGNVLSLTDLKKAAKHFNPKLPIAIINEGLMRYLNFEEKRKLAGNIHTLLSRFGGVWITSDISLKKTQEGENQVNTGHIKRISEMTGVDIVGNRFENVTQGKKFFNDLGFSIESHSFMEVEDQLYSVKKLNILREDVLRLNKDAVVFVMNIAQNKARQY